MKIEITEVVTNVEIIEQRFGIIEVADFALTDAVRKSMFTEAGQLIVSTGAATPAVLGAPAAGGDALVSDLAEAGKMKWEPLGDAAFHDASEFDAAGDAAAVQADLDAHKGSGGAAHADVVSGGASGFITGANQAKLDGIAVGATANTKATGGEIDAGVDDVKFATSKAIRDSGLLSAAVAGEINALTNKVTPANSDVFLAEDSGVGLWPKIKVTWTNIKATLKTYFDTLYAVAAKGVTNGDSHDHSGGDGAQIAYSSLSGARERLTAARTYYVRTDGNDNNTGLVNTAGGAFLTIQHAVDVAASLDTAGYQVIIQVGDGTYTGQIVLYNVEGSTGAADNVLIQGNAADPDAVVISTSGTAITASRLATVWTLKYLKIETSGSTAYGIAISGQTNLILSGTIEFGACTGYHMAIVTGSTLVLASGAVVNISGGGQGHLLMRGGWAQYRNFTQTITNTPAWSVAYITLLVGSGFYGDAITFSGSATGPRFNLSGNSHIYTNGGGLNYFPGNAAGVLTSGSYDTYDTGEAAGTAFPANPITNMRFFRTDLGLECYYDGTRWLTINEYMVSFTRLEGGTTDGGSYGYMPARSDYQPYFTRVEMKTKVDTTNNGSHFWYIQALGCNLAHSSFASIFIAWTSGDTAGTWTNHSSAPDNATITDDDVLLLYVSKNGSPGAISAEMTIFYKLIIT